MSRKPAGRQLQHFVFCPKYRRSILNPDVWATVDAAIRHICQLRKIEVIAVATDAETPDHVHVFAQLPHAISPSQAAGAIKWYSSVVARRKHPELKLLVHENHLWQRRFFADTVGKNAPIVQRYIERQSAPNP